jgi:hypothetical protein
MAMATANEASILGMDATLTTQSHSVKLQPEPITIACASWIFPRSIAYEIWSADSLVRFYTPITPQADRAVRLCTPITPQADKAVRAPKNPAKNLRNSSRRLHRLTQGCTTEICQEHVRPFTGGTGGNRDLVFISVDLVSSCGRSLVMVLSTELPRDSTAWTFLVVPCNACPRPGLPIPSALSTVVPPSQVRLRHGT